MGGAALSPKDAAGLEKDIGKSNSGLHLSPLSSFGTVDDMATLIGTATANNSNR